MNPPPRPPAQTDDKSLSIRPRWSVGPRTVAWDSLWRAILTDIGSLPRTDAHKAAEAECDDA